MKFFISIFLISTILLQSLSSMITVVAYEINKEYITKTFCENKDKPSLHCDGKCHLMKQINELQKKENAPQNNIKEKMEMQLFSESKSSLKLLNSFILVEYTSFFWINNSTPHLNTVFRPPSC